VKFFASAGESARLPSFRRGLYLAISPHVQGGLQRTATERDGGKGLRRTVVSALALLLACAPARQEVDMEAGGESPPELASGLNVRVEADATRLELHVTNAADAPITLEFATAQRYDFEVLDGSGVVVWRWSDDLMFAQVLGEEVLASGETRSYREALPELPQPGEYMARALLMSHNYPVDMRTPFRVGDE
jgi:hypothetical protein